MRVFAKATYRSKSKTIVASYAPRGLCAKNKFFLVGQHPKPFNNFCKIGYAPAVLNTQKNYDTANVVKNVSVHKLRDSLSLKSPIVYDKLKKTVGGCSA